MQAEDGLRTEPTRFHLVEPHQVAHPASTASYPDSTVVIRVNVGITMGCVGVHLDLGGRIVWRLVSASLLFILRGIIWKRREGRRRKSEADMSSLRCFDGWGCEISPARRGIVWM